MDGNTNNLSGDDLVGTLSCAQELRGARRIPAKISSRILERIHKEMSKKILGFFSEKLLVKSLEKILIVFHGKSPHRIAGEVN